jgi:hypothetical protein
MRCGSSETTAELLLRTSLENVQSETAGASRSPYTQSMQTDHLKSALMVTWILTVGILGYLSGTTSLAAWTALGIVSLTFPIVMMKLWRVPAQSMSESIQEARR